MLLWGYLICWPVFSLTKWCFLMSSSHFGDFQFVMLFHYGKCFYFFFDEFFINLRSWDVSWYCCINGILICPMKLTCFCVWCKIDFLFVLLMWVLLFSPVSSMFCVYFLPFIVIKFILLKEFTLSRFFLKKNFLLILCEFYIMYPTHLPDPFPPSALASPPSKEKKNHTNRKTNNV